MIEPAKPARLPRPWLFGRPLAVQVGLDLAGVVLIIATVLQVDHPDVLLHTLWIVLVLQAFMFGFRVTVVRLSVGFAFVIGYAMVADRQGLSTTPLEHLDFAEWPLMMVIAFLVAVMAERLTRAGERSNRRLLVGQQDERHRIALDLHDGVGQTLAALTYTLDALITSLESDHDAAASRALEKAQRARGIANVALEETRDVASRLRPLRLAETGLAAAIEELVANSMVPVDVAIAPELRRPGILPQETEATALRIVQEALGNSIRHARATHRWVRMEASARDRVLLTIGDDGVGFDVGKARGKGIGLHGMAERAAAIDGRLAVSSHDGQGSLVQLELALPAQLRRGLARAGTSAVPL